MIFLQKKYSQFCNAISTIRYIKDRSIQKSVLALIFTNAFKIAKLKGLINSRPLYNVYIGVSQKVVQLTIGSIPLL